MAESKIHKALRFPYMISLPDNDGDQWVTKMVKTPKDEAELNEFFPEFYDGTQLDYFKEKGVVDPEGSAELFYAHYESVGWFKGRSKIKSWRMCLNSWDFKRKGDVQVEQISRPPMYKLECVECGFASETDRKDTRMVCRRCEHRPLMVVTNLIK